MKFSNNSISVLAYCDDLLFMTNSRKDMRKIAQVLTKFLRDNDMDINPNKTIYTSNNPKNTLVVINNHIVRHTSPSTHFKYLGIWFSLDLNWEKSSKICIQSALRST